HLTEAGHLPELPLERRRHRGGHDVGAGPGIERRHLDRRIIDLRQRGDRELRVGHHAYDEQPDHQKRRGDGTQDEEARRIHPWLPAPEWRAPCWPCPSPPPAPGVRVSILLPD